MSGFNVQILLRLVDQLTGPSRRISQSYREMQRNVTAASAGLNTATAGSTAGFNRMGNAANMANASVSRLATNMRNLRTLSAGFTGLGLGGGGAMIAAFPLVHMLKNAANYEDKLLDIRKVWQGSEKDYERMVASLRKLNAQIPLPRSDIATLLEEGVKSGISKDVDELAEFTLTAAKFSKAFQLDNVEDAAQKLAKVKGSLGLTMPEFTAMADSMNTVAANFATTEVDLLDIVRRVGGLSKAIGGSQGLADLIMIGGAQTAAGVKREVGATGLRTMLARLSAQPSDTLKGLKAIGLSPETVKKNLPTDMFGTIFEILTRISELPVHRQAGVLSQIAGMRTFDAFAPLLGNLEIMEKLKRIYDDPYRLTLDDEYERRITGINSALQLTSNILGELSDSIVMLWKPQIIEILKTMQGLSESMKGSSILQWTAAAFAGLAALSLIALPFGILGASIFSVALGFRVLTSATKKFLVPFRFLWRLGVGGLATLLAGIGVGVAGAAKAFGRAVGLGWRFAGAIGAVTMAWRALRRALGIGLVVEGLLFAVENWSKLVELSKNPLRLQILFPQAPNWLQWLVSNAEREKEKMNDSMEATRNRASGWLDGARNWMVRGDVNDYGVGHWAPSFAGIGDVGVPEVLRRRPEEHAKSGSGQIGIGTQNLTSTTNSHNSVVNNVTVNVQSNADPAAIGNATANAIGRKINGALSDAPHSAP